MRKHMALITRKKFAPVEKNGNYESCDCRLQLKAGFLHQMDVKNAFLHGDLS